MKNEHTICLFLGPFRNLSTAVGSYLSLHPECQVLNHGWYDINTTDNFLINYEEDNVKNFTKLVVDKSNTSDKIGSMITSHAYKSNKTFGEEYKKRFNDKLIKDDIKSYVWKEGGRISRELRNNGLIEKIVKDNPNIKFLRPVRNPIRCAISNIERKHGKHFSLKEKEISKNDFLTELMAEYKWIYDLQKKYPNNFFFLHENDMVNGLDKIQKFLCVEEDKEWVNSCSKIDIVKHPINDNGLKKLYSEIINRYFGDDEKELNVLKSYL